MAQQVMEFAERTDSIKLPSDFLTYAWDRDRDTHTLSKSN